jgi:hypothetical protein
MFLRILGQHFHFNFHPIQAILRQIFVFIKCSKHLQCFCVEISRRINFDNQKIFFSIFFSKTAWISLKSLPKQPFATFRLKSRLPYNTTYGRATQAVSTHCSRTHFLLYFDSRTCFCRKKKYIRIHFFFRYVFFFVKNCILKNTGFETVSGLVRPKNTSFVHKNSKITILTGYFDHFQPPIF